MKTITLLTPFRTSKHYAHAPVKDSVSLIVSRCSACVAVATWVRRSCSKQGHKIYNYCSLTHMAMIYYRQTSMHSLNSYQKVPMYYNTRLVVVCIAIICIQNTLAAQHSTTYRYYTLI